MKDLPNQTLIKHTAKFFFFMACNAKLKGIPQLSCTNKNQKKLS